MKKLSLAFFALCLSANSAAAERLNYPAFGFSVETPEGWVLQSNADVRENLDRVDLGSDKFKALVKKYAQVPFLNLTQFNEPYPELNSSFRVNTRPGHIKNPRETLVLVSDVFKTAFDEFELVSTPTDSNIGGQAAAFMEFNYLLRSSDGASGFATRSTVYIVPNGDHFFLIGMATNNPPEPEVQALLDRTVASIRID